MLRRCTYAYSLNAALVGPARYPLARLRALTALVVLREKVIRPLLAASTRPEPHSKLSNPTPIDQHYENLRAGMRGLFTELGVAA